MNKDAEVFKPDDIIITLDGKDYCLKYDLNAFCELEKIYPSVDNVLQMLLGTTAAPDLEKVTFQDKPVLASDIKIAGVPLAIYVNKINEVKEAKHSDTLNLLWAGCIHAYCDLNKFDEIIGYKLSKSKLGMGVTFKNLREVNAKILTAILRDLIPSPESKNAEAPEVPEPQQPQLTLRK